jgi:signal transduction histidine kinase
MLTMVNSILDLARLESGKMELQLEDVAVGGLFETATQQVAPLAMRANVAITHQVGEGAEAVHADAEFTVRVLVNLLSNALRYSPANSTITISATGHAADRVTIRVIDQGPGISPELSGKVFNKFTQVEARKAGSGVGSGLGLSFCRLAVQAQGGRIWLEGTAGGGTTAIFTLPRSAPDS